MTGSLVDYRKTVRIPNGVDLSDSVDLENNILVGIFVPETFDGDSIGIEVGKSDTEFSTAGNGTSNDADLTLAISGTDRYIPLPQPTLGLGWRKIKLKSSDPQASGDAVFTLATIPR